MKVVRMGVGSPDPKIHSHRSVCAIGTFDGIHLGHKAVLEAAKRVRSNRDRLVCITFEPHPARILRPENAPRLLTGLDQRADLLAEIGFDLLLAIDFDQTLAALSEGEFVEFLKTRLNLSTVVTGVDFHFGSKRSGNLKSLTALGSEFGFDVQGVELVELDGQPVSSTRIRRALAGGEVGLAATLLGRPHEVRGVVVRGDQRGRAIGFPTANVEIEPTMAQPADAVYAGYFIAEDEVPHRCAINVGKRPTFHQNQSASITEAHLIDFEGDLYDQRVRVQFVELLRSERRFDGAEALKAQLSKDVATARAVLSD